jgi:hypothetical protein
METKLRPGTVPFRQLEGSHLDLDVTNGARLCSVAIVLAGRGDLMSRCLDVDGTDLIINKTDVLNMREATSSRARDGIGRGVRVIETSLR